nr:MAG TPA: hypothetical protein [Caudoviricetes sp.]
MAEMREPDPSDRGPYYLIISHSSPKINSFGR